jgi:hypothetical protein
MPWCAPFSPDSEEEPDSDEGTVARRLALEASSSTAARKRRPGHIENQNCPCATGNRHYWLDAVGVRDRGKMAHVQLKLAPPSYFPPICYFLAGPRAPHGRAFSNQVPAQVPPHVTVATPLG